MKFLHEYFVHRHQHQHIVHNANVSMFDVIVMEKFHTREATEVAFYVMNCSTFDKFDHIDFTSNSVSLFISRSTVLPFIQIRFYFCLCEFVFVCMHASTHECAKQCQDLLYYCFYFHSVNRLLFFHSRSKQYITTVNNIINNVAGKRNGVLLLLPSHASRKFYDCPKLDRLLRTRERDLRTRILCHFLIWFLISFLANWNKKTKCVGESGNKQMEKLINENWWHKCMRRHRGLMENEHKSIAPKQSKAIRSKEMKTHDDK